jgi:hypothetical protein
VQGRVGGAGSVGRARKVGAGVGAGLGRGACRSRSFWVLIRPDSYIKF